MTATRAAMSDDQIKALWEHVRGHTSQISTTPNWRQERRYNR